MHIYRNLTILILDYRTSEKNGWAEFFQKYVTEMTKISCLACGCIKNVISNNVPSSWKETNHNSPQEIHRFGGKGRTGGGGGGSRDEWCTNPRHWTKGRQVLSLVPFPGRALLYFLKDICVRECCSQAVSVSIKYPLLHSLEKVVEPEVPQPSMLCCGLRPFFERFEEITLGSNWLGTWLQNPLDLGEHQTKWLAHGVVSRGPLAATF